MKVDFSGFAKSKSFDDLLSDIWHRQLSDRHRLLKTCHHSGFITDGYLISKLSSNEVDHIQKLHKKALSGSESYRTTEQLDLIEIWPAKLGASVERINYAGKGSEYNLVLITDGHGLDVLAEATAANTLVKRHPRALWHFSYGRGYWKKPIVLLENEGFFKGKVVGAISPIQIKDAVHEGKSVGNPSLIYVVKGKERRYIPETNEDE